VQTTLLSIAIAMILALLAALVGPHVVRWNDHRDFFEAEVSRLVGVKVKVGGDIDATLLPSPSVTLRAIAIGPAGSGRRMQARSLRIELALGPLMRGDLRATEMRLVSPQFNIGLDGQGQIDWPSLSLANETLSIDRLSIEDGRATLSDPASKSKFELEQFWFRGDVRSLTGPIRGKGEFVSAGRLYGYDISTARATADGTRLKLSLKNDEHPLVMDAEGLLALDRGTPRFDGALTLSRPAGAVLASGKAVALEPWRLTGKVKAAPASAVFDDVSFQYGPDERSVTLAGFGDFKFGATPQLQGVLSTRQVDLDRLLATPEAPRRLPMSAVQAFGEMLGGALRPSWPIKLSLSVDAMMLGGATVQNVGSDLRSDGDAWTVDRLELRAPGFTQVKVDGRLYPLGQGLGFAGGMSVDSNDPKNLVAWLAGRSTTTAQYKPWRAKGDVTLRADRIAVEHLRTEIDRDVVEGSLSYTWPAGDRPARLDGELRAANLDLDGALVFGNSAFSGLGLERPGEITLAAEVGHAKIAGFDARDIAARLKMDAGGLAIERLSIRDLGDTSFVASGHIRTQGSPGGSITVNLDARDLNGVIALSDRFAPALAPSLRWLAIRQRTATLQANISMEDSGADAASGKIGLTGKAGAIRLNVAATATGKRDAFMLTDLRALTGASIHIDGDLQADTAAPLLAIIGLDRIVADNGKPARLDVSVSGPLGRELAIEGKLAAGPIDATGKGTLRLAYGQPVTLDFDQLAGTVGGNKARGRATLRFEDVPRLDGMIEAEDLDAPAMVAAAIGAPPASGAGWSVDPISWGPLGLAGQIGFKAQRAAFAPWLVAQNLSGTVRFDGQGVTFESIAGELGKGRLDGRLAVSNGVAGVSAKLRLGLSDAELGAIVPSEGRAASSGRLALQTELEGTGRSPAAFIGSLSGFGQISIEQARLVGLNPQVFAAVTRAVELGIPTEGPRLREFVTGALDNAALAVSKGSAAIGISAGQARLRDVSLRADGADLQATVNLDLTDATLDAVLTLSAPRQAAPAQPSSADVQSAVMVMLKGPLVSPARSVDTNLMKSWLTLRAVEQQSRQLEAMERAARAAMPQPDKAAVPAELPPAAATSPASAPARSPPSPNGVSGDFQPAPAPSPPVTIPTAPKPRTTPRTDGAAPPRSNVRPNLIGAQN
jgi:uncharacterized protein involved in outer membrane biogenesis